MPMLPLFLDALESPKKDELQMNQDGASSILDSDQPATTELPSPLKPEGYQVIYKSIQISWNAISGFLCHINLFSILNQNKTSLINLICC